MAQIQPIRIGILGPESTGKSTLSQRLADYYGATLFPEWARCYVQTIKGPITYDNVCMVFEENVRSYHAAQGLTFYDTEVIITKVWFDHAFQRHPKELDLFLQQHPMDIYLITEPDLPWIADPTREHGLQSGA